jgi:hypothetical protein
LAVVGSCSMARLPGCATAGSGPWRWRACGPPVSDLRCGRAALGFVLRVGGGLPPRRCACTGSRGPVCASALAVAAVASSTAWRTRGSSHSAAAAAAASAAVHRAAAAALSLGLYRSSVGLRVTAGSAWIFASECHSGPAAAEALAALAGQSLPLAVVRPVLRFTTGLKDGSLLITA